MHGLQLLEIVEEIACLGRVVSVALQSRNKLALLCNMALSERDVLFGLRQMPL